MTRRLTTSALAGIPPEIERFCYDRDAQDVGIVHFGIGAFHRAHQAWYTDRAMDSGDRNWAITGVSLRSRTVAQQMNPQDALYSVTERSASNDAVRLIGSIRTVVPASAGRGRIKGLVAAPTTRIVSFTITEKGYCRTADGALDPDLANETSVFPVLVDGLRRRRDAGNGGLTLLSCDNLANNGVQLARLIGEYLDRHDPALRAWFERECACPSSMVDRIVPATTETDLTVVASRIGVQDHAAVLTEPFSQWVIEDVFAAGRPSWDRFGVEMVGDVATYETAKLRMLNGTHSALAYLGLMRGHQFVHEAVTDPVIRPLVERLMSDEAATSFAPAPGQNLGAYAKALLFRFENSALQHRLSQIAADGSQKIPQRWLATIAAQRERGRRCPSILTALAAWVIFIRGRAVVVDDPLADSLSRVWAGRDLEQTARALFSPGGLMASDWQPDSKDFSMMKNALA